MNIGFGITNSLANQEKALSIITDLVICQCGVIPVIDEGCNKAFNSKIEKLTDHTSINSEFGINRLLYSDGFVMLYDEDCFKNNDSVLTKSAIFTLENDKPLIMLVPCEKNINYDISKLLGTDNIHVLSFDENTKINNPISKVINLILKAHENKYIVKEYR